MLAQEKKMMLLSKNIFFVLPIAAVRQESGGVLDCVVEHHFTNAPLPLGTGCPVTFIEKSVSIDHTRNCIST